MTPARSRSPWSQSTLYTVRSTLGKFWTCFISVQNVYPSNWVIYLCFVWYDFLLSEEAFLIYVVFGFINWSYVINSWRVFTENNLDFIYDKTRISRVELERFMFLSSLRNCKCWRLQLCSSCWTWVKILVAHLFSREKNHRKGAQNCLLHDKKCSHVTKCGWENVEVSQWGR